MNNLLQLKGQFKQRKNSNVFGPINLPKGAVVTAEHIKDMAVQLKNLENHWQTDRRIGGALISVHYKCIVAKSNRLQILLGRT